MALSRTFVIVGAALCGATAAVRLREEGFDGRIVLIGAEDHLPYGRPPLSKEYLRGEEPFDDALVGPPDLYAEREIDLRTGTRVVQIRPKERSIARSFPPFSSGAPRSKKRRSSRRRRAS